MSLAKKIVCGIVGALLLALGVFLYVQWDNIRVLYMGVRYSTEELEQQLAKNEQKIKEASQAVSGITIRELTDADKQALKDGAITREQLIQSMLVQVAPEGRPDSQQPPQTTQTSGQPADKPAQQTEPGVGSGVPSPQPEPGVGSEVPSPQPEPEEVQVGEYQRQLALLIAEVYVLREEFLQKLDVLMKQGIADYSALRKSGDSSGGKIAELVNDYLSKGLEMEKECDAQMQEIITQLDTLLSEHGESTSLSNDIYEAYVEQKSLKKAWYMAELKERGLIS